MKKLSLTWNIGDEAKNHSVKRYCHNCGRKVLFTDSSIKRHNANGKNIYQYAIYKCPKGHTWNRKLDQYKANGHTLEHNHTDVLAMVRAEFGSEDNFQRQGNVVGEGEEQIDSFSWEECVQKGVQEVEIRIHHVKGKWRLDKVLADRIEDQSRTVIAQRIQEGNILVNHQRVKPNFILRDKDRIKVLLYTENGI